MTDQNNVTRIPISMAQRVRNKMGKGYVPCEVSSRYLMFDLESCKTQGAGESFAIGVMTARDWEDGPLNPRRLCEVIVSREDLLRALDAVKPRQTASQ